MQGVYKIVNNKNNKIYVGSSRNIFKRFDRHLKDLRKGRHHNTKLQLDFNSFADMSLELVMIEGVENSEDLHVREDHWIKELNSKELCYNIGDANFGDTLSYHPDKAARIDKIKASLKNTINILTDEERKKLYGSCGIDNGNYNQDINHFCIFCGEKLSHSTISRRGDNCNNCRDRSGDKNPFYGKKHSTETRKKLSEASKGVRRSSKKISAEGVVFEACIDCARHFGISASLVTYRIKSKSHPDWFRVNAERPSKG